MKNRRITVEDYPDEALHELAGIFTLAMWRMNKIIIEKGYDADKTWALVNKEYEQLTGAMKGATKDE